MFSRILVIALALLMSQTMVLGVSAQGSGGDPNTIITYLGMAVAGLVVMVVLIFIFMSRKKPAEKVSQTGKPKTIGKDDYMKMVDYVNESLQKGYDEAYITEMLIGRGMSEDSVVRAIREARLDM